MSEIHDPYDDQLRAARYRAERDLARDQLERANRRICELEAEAVERRTVRAEDGKPLREGETVWHIKTGREYVVVEPSYGKTVVVRLAKYDDAEGEQYAPDQLTHERPDSWERLEEDAREISHDVSWNLGNWSPSDFKEAGDNVLARIESLIPRAKALAERGQ